MNTALPTLESVPIGNYGESVMQFRMPPNWRADYAEYLKQYEEQQKLNKESLNVR